MNKQTNNYKYAIKTIFNLLSTTTLWFLLSSRRYNNRLSSLITRLYRSIPILLNSNSILLLLHNFTSHSHESSFDISTILCWSLYKFNTKRISKFLSCFIRNNLLSSKISLITNKYLYNILISITINFMEPSLYIVERILICYIVNNNNAMSTTIIRRSNSTETFLTSSIPLYNKIIQRRKSTICNFTVLPSRSTVRIFYTIINP